MVQSRVIETAVYELPDGRQVAATVLATVKGPSGRRILARIGDKTGLDTKDCDCWGDCFARFWEWLQKQKAGVNPLHTCDEPAVVGRVGSAAPA